MAGALGEDEDLCGGEPEHWASCAREVGGVEYRQRNGRHLLHKLGLFMLVAGCVAALVALQLKPSRVTYTSPIPRLVQMNVVAPKDMQGLETDAKREEADVKPAPFAPLLLCFVMCRVTGYEPELLNAQFYNKAGIFACDEHKVYSTGGVAHIGSLLATEVVAPEANVGDFSDEGTATDSWLNTMTFIKAWDLLIDEGRWWTNDWTVKVDPDAVFFPDRLRTKVEPHTGGLNAAPLWVGNCDRVWHNSQPHLKLFGSLEVFSRNAIGTYKAYKEKCRKDLPWQGWGEDMFMQECMKHLKVKAINGTDFLGDKRCYDAPCTDIHKVAFHDFKAVKPFFQCWGQSKGSERVYREEQERLKKLAEKQKRELERAEKLAAERLKREKAEQLVEQEKQDAEEEKLKELPVEQEKQD